MQPHSGQAGNHTLAAAWERLTAAERRVVEYFLARRAVARDTQREWLDKRTTGERLADQIAAFGGSWTFIGIFVGVVVAWIAVNTVLVTRPKAFDPFPFILLNLLLSMIAALQAPIILMSQNREAAKDRLRAEHDYEVNLKAEMEIRSLHEKLDGLREQSWVELFRMQQEQIGMLQQVLATHTKGTL
jgi:uncharacterized membrane protein